MTHTALSASKLNPTEHLPARHPSAGFHLPGHNEVEPRRRLGFRPAPVENLPLATSFSCLPRREAPAAPNKGATPQQRRKHQNSNKAPDKGERSEARARRRLLRAQRGRERAREWERGVPPITRVAPRARTARLGRRRWHLCKGRLLGPLGPRHGRAVTWGMLMPRGYPCPVGTGVPGWITQFPLGHGAKGPRVISSHKTGTSASTVYSSCCSCTQ